MDFWFNEDCVVFHMIDSQQDNYELGLECCLTNEYYERQRQQILSVPNNDIRIYEHELSIPVFSYEKESFPVIIHRTYCYKECNKSKLHDLTERDHLYILSEDGKIIYGWNKASGLIGKGVSILDIPEGVEEIAEGAFAGCGDIIHVKFPKTLKTIGRGAFVGCGNFEINFRSKHIEYIGEFAFWECNLYLNNYTGEKCLPETIRNCIDNAFKDTRIYYKGEEFLIWLAKRNGIWDFRIVEKNAFEQTINTITINKNTNPFPDIVFDETVEDNDGVIYDRSFQYVLECKNNNLTKYKINESAISIYPGVFRGQSQLEEIDLSGIKYIGKEAFDGCEKLRIVTFGDNIKHIGEDAFKRTGIQKLILPNSLTYLGASAFSYCDKLCYVEITSSLEKIEQETFRDCKFLKHTKLPEEIVSIGRLAFGNCISLQRINMPQKLTKIGELAFCNCAIDKVILPQSLLHMDYSPFCGCRKTTIISESPLFYANEQFLLGYHKTRLISYLADEVNIVIPGTVKAILGYSLFNQNKKAKIYLPNSVNYIGHWAFRYAKAKQINFPKSVTFVKSSFDYCTSIELYIIDENASELLNGSAPNSKIMKYNNDNILIDKTV